MDYFGVGPEKVIDVQALAGDSTDNVPGAPGIGVKTAAELINEYGDLETLLARAGEIKQPKRREALTNPENVDAHPDFEATGDARSATLRSKLSSTSSPCRSSTARSSSPSSRRWSSPRSPAASPRSAAIESRVIEPDPRFVGPAGWRGRDGEAALAREQEAAAASPAPRLRRRRAAPGGDNACGSRRHAAKSKRKAPNRSRRRTRRCDTLDELRRLDRRGARGRPCRFRHRNIFARSDAGRSHRRVARDRSRAKPATFRSAIAKARTISLTAAGLCRIRFARTTRSRL